MRIRHLGQIWFILILFLSTSHAQSSDSTITIDHLIQEMKRNNPSLKAGYNEWQAARARVPQAGALPDPVLGINLLNMPVNTFAFDQEPMTGKQISLMQPLPFPGKLGLKEEIAQQSAQISEFQYQEMENDLVSQLKRLYNELLYVNQAIATTRKNHALLEQFTTIAEMRYRVGKGIQQDVLRSQVEHLKLHDKLIELGQKRIDLEAEINTLLNRPADQALGKPVGQKISQTDLVLDSLKRIADDDRPLLLAWKTSLIRSQKKTHLAQKGMLPDFGIGAAYTQRDKLKNGTGGVDFLSATFNMTLPVYFWKKQKKNVEENKFSELSVQQQYQDVRNQVFRRLETTRTDLEKNRRRIELYRDGIIPQASQAVESALAAYQVDKVDFLSLLNNQLTLFNYELALHRAVSDYLNDVADLERETGHSISGVNNSGDN